MANPLDDIAWMRFLTLWNGVGDVVEVITASGNELLLIFCIIPLVGLGVGLTKRLMNMN